MFNQYKSKSLTKHYPSNSTTTSARLPKVMKAEAFSFKRTHCSDKTKTSIEPSFLPNKNYNQSTKINRFIDPKDNHKSEANIKTEKNITTIKNQMKINNEIMYKKQENRANSKFNKRMLILKQIKKDNEKFFERINSQKSLYSQKSMRKSTVSIQSSSKKNSRLSTKGNSSQRQIERENKKSHKSMEYCRPITIQPESISKIKQPIIDQFKSMFLRANTQRKISNSYSKKQNRSLSMKNEQIIQREKTEMGNMLHKIAEVMFKTRQKTIM